MTREEALLKLLAVEPETRDQIILVTGWPADETGEVLDRLLEQRKVTYSNWAGPRRGFGVGGRRYYPTTNAV